MALAITVTKHWDDGKAIHAIGTLAASGNYATGGDTIPTDLKIKSSQAPMFMMFNFLSKYQGCLNGTKLKIYVPDTGLEVAAGAYPAGITGDTITFYGVWRKK